MVIDINKCSGCYNCTLACKDEHCGHDYPGYSASQPMTGHFWMRLIERERGKYPKVKVAYTPIPCMQCSDAACIKAATDGAVYRREDGIVIIDPVKAKGQKQIVSACPYRAIYWNEELQLPQKCTFCAHLLDEGWKEPRCVELCPTGAIMFGDMEDKNSQVARTFASGEILHPEYELKDSVVYLNLPKKFIAGTLAYSDTDECAGNVLVTLSSVSQQQTAMTDNFGDFDFEGLADNIEYTVTIEAQGYKTRILKTKTITDVYLGVIKLAR